VAFYTDAALGGVISGYLPEQRRVTIDGQEIDVTVIENTGIVVAWQIKHAMDAIPAALADSTHAT
jgi:hypothetical protein